MANQIVELIEQKIQALGLEGSKSHFSHTHTLALCSFLDGYSVPCNYCNDIIRPPIPAYCCIDCEFCIHICCSKINEDVLKAQLKDNSFYRQHDLSITLMSNDESKDCRACTKIIRGISLSSSSNPFDLHVSCIEPPTRALKHKSHTHSLFYFRDKSLSSLKCCVCCEECDDSLYRCMICDKNFHLECLPVPRVVKNDDSHIHPLMLLGSLELIYDGEKYSCAICRKQGKAAHHAYFCDECNIFAHVECVLNEENTSLEVEDSQKRPMKHECHEHNLFYILEKGDPFSNLSCKICSKKCKCGFYWCPECRIGFHIDCIPLPRIIVLMELTNYRISFILVDLVADHHDSDHDPLCEFCKKTTNLEIHVYFCQELDFFAHIECLLAEGNIMSSSKKLLPLGPVLQTVDELQDAEELSTERSKMDNTFVLPAQCISHVISFTTPRDACRLSVVSPNFKSAADSDAVWEKFLPANLSLIPSLSKKKLYFHLCHIGIRINENMGFTLDQESGKIIYFVGARGLTIHWGSEPQCWKWLSLPETWFPEVAELKYVLSFDIIGRIDTKNLSTKTNYVAYFVFKFVESRSGFQTRPMAFDVYFEGSANHQWSSIFLDPPENEPQRVEDVENGWKRIKIGEFFNDDGNAGTVVCRISEIDNGNIKQGIVVHGIAVRPTYG